MLRGLIRLTRPKQWVKNVLVAAAPLAAGTLLHPSVLAHTMLAFLAFCFASGATYCFNDVVDAESDRRHPTKRHRPVASGAVSPHAAVALATLLAVASLAIKGPWQFRACIAAYLVLQVLYSTVLKHQPVIELGLVSSGFLLRAVGGGLATDLPISRWFLIVASFGSLFIVTGKRLSELTRAQDTGAAMRRSLTYYPLSYLRMVLGVCASVTIASYCLWAFEVGAEHRGSAWTAISIAPFVLAILRYALDTDQGRAEEPEDVILRDSSMQALGVLWLGAFALGVLT